MTFQFIKTNRSVFPVKKMCQILEVSRSGYYAWGSRPESKRSIENKELRQRILELYIEHGQMAGSPMITADLQAEERFGKVSRTRVARKMKEMDLRCKTVRKFVVTTDSSHKEAAAPNLLDRQFSVSKPNTVWVTDITYMKVGRNWFYLTVFIDLFSRAIVGWDLSDSLEKSSVIRAFKKSLVRRRPPEGLMVHSDQGVQYASHEFRKLLMEHGCIQSMSRRGNCWDNAVAESFFHTLKTQMVYHRKFSDKQEAEIALFQYIEAYYNRRRRHSSNGWLSPAQFETTRQGNMFVA